GPLTACRHRPRVSGGEPVYLPGGQRRGAAAHHAVPRGRRCAAWRCCECAWSADRGGCTERLCPLRALAGGGGYTLGGTPVGGDSATVQPPPGCDHVHAPAGGG